MPDARAAGAPRAGRFHGLWGAPGTRTFLLVWSGQIVSLIGSGLTAFALGVWIYQRTASTTQYALVTFCAALPPLVVLPLAGPLVDRFDRQRLLIACDLAAALSTATVGVLAFTHALSLPWVCLIAAVNASASAVQWPTWSASVTLLVPREHLGRASGMTTLAMATSQILAPLIAGTLLAAIGLVGIVAIDLATFLVSLALLTRAAIPKPPPAASQGTRSAYWREVPRGWTYILRQRGLTALLLTFAATNFLTELATVLFTPMVLSFADAAALGSILFAGGIGMLAGGLLMSAWGGPRRPALGSVGFAAVAGGVVASTGLTTSVAGLAVLAALFFFLTPLISGCSQVVWQSVVPPQLQGRVFSARSAITMAAVPVASLVAGPLADRLFEPGMAGAGALAHGFGPLVGVGRGRGIAALILLSGALSVAAAVVGSLCRPLRRLDAGGSAAPEPTLATQSVS